MATNIEWTQETWNPTVGCDKVSAGCKHCYAIRMAWRLAHIPAMKDLYGDTVKKSENGQVNWTGVVKVSEDAMMKPFEFKKPTMFFVDSMSDLFHKNISFRTIDRVFTIMAACPQHTFQILTKRPERMAEYFAWKDTDWSNEGMQGDDRIRYYCYHNHGVKIERKDWKWPLPNVWLGVSVEDQQQADARIPHLLKAPAAIRFLSCEPLLERVDLTKYISGIHQVKPTYSDEEVLGMLGDFLRGRDGEGIALVMSVVLNEQELYSDDEQKMILKGYNLVQRLYNSENK